MLKKRQIRKYASDISYQAVIGKNVSFPHPIGIVIGVGVVIQDNVGIWQHVTLGSVGKGSMIYPVINKGAKLFANCQVIGNVTIGANAKIGASSLVLNDVPEDKTAVGIPAKII